MIHITKII